MLAEGSRDSPRSLGTKHLINSLGLSRLDENRISYDQLRGKRGAGQGDAENCGRSLVSPIINVARLLSSEPWSLNSLPSLLGRRSRRRHLISLGLRSDASLPYSSKCTHESLKYTNVYRIAPSAAVQPDFVNCSRPLRFVLRFRIRNNKLLSHRPGVLVVEPNSVG